MEYNMFKSTVTYIFEITNEHQRDHTSLYCIRKGVVSQWNNDVQARLQVYWPLGDAQINLSNNTFQFARAVH